MYGVENFRVVVGKKAGVEWGFGLVVGDVKIEHLVRFDVGALLY